LDTKKKKKFTGDWGRHTFLNDNSKR